MTLTRFQLNQIRVEMWADRLDPLGEIPPWWHASCDCGWGQDVDSEDGGWTQATRHLEDSTDPHHLANQLPETKENER